MRITLEMTPDEATHVAECLEISAEANGGNAEEAPDGRTWEAFSLDLLRLFAAAGVSAGLLDPERWPGDGDPAGLGRAR